MTSMPESVVNEMFCMAADLPKSALPLLDFRQLCSEPTAEAAHCVIVATAATTRAAMLVLPLARIAVAETRGRA